MEVLILPILIVGSLGPVRHELAVEHLQYSLLTHSSADLLRRLVELFGKSFSDELPKEGVVPSIGVGADRLVEGILIDGVVVDDLTIISHPEDGVIVVGEEVPVQPVPRGEHHVLCTLVHHHKVLGEDVPPREAIHVEVVGHLTLKLGGVALAVDDPLPQATYGSLLCLAGGVPLDPVRVAEFKSSLKGRHVVRGKESEWLGVIEELQAHALLFLDESEDLLAAALVVVEVVLTQVGVVAIPIEIKEGVHWEAVDSYSNALRSLLGRS